MWQRATRKQGMCSLRTTYNLICISKLQGHGQKREEKKNKLPSMTCKWMVMTQYLLW